MIELDGGNLCDTFTLQMVNQKSEHETYFLKNLRVIAHQLMCFSTPGLIERFVNHPKSHKIFFAWHAMDSSRT